MYLIGGYILPIEWERNSEGRNNSAGNNHNNLEGEADNHGDHDACNPQKNRYKHMRLQLLTLIS
jgi:hypothetical protein